MFMVNVLNKKSYTRLLTDICSTYEQARQTIVKTYWEIGRLIVEEEEHHSSESGYGLYLMRRISNDLVMRYGKGFSVSNLKGMRRFYLRYRIGQTSVRLAWSHYQLLATVPDDAQRKMIERRAVKEALSCRELEAIIIKEKKKEPACTKEVALLSDSRGALWTYVVHEVTEIAKKKKRVVVDCGFNVLREYYTSAALKQGECVVLAKRESAISSVRIKKVPQSRKENRYMYQAVVERVIDGDTLWALIDTGMGVVVREKLRLSAIDTPELKSKDGQRAKLFVMKQLKDSPFIIIKTSKSDKYDRYLAGIYYLPKEKDPAVVAREGRYLNQELLNEHLAHPV